MQRSVIKNVCGVLVLVLLAGCRRPSRSHESGDGGVLQLDVTLDAPPTTLTGTVWPNGGLSGRPLSMHAVNGRSRVTVHLLSGRTLAFDADDVIFTLDEERGTVRSVAMSMRRPPVPWGEAEQESLQFAKGLGVPEALLRAQELRFATERPGTWYASYPVEGCVVATSSMYEKRKRSWALSYDLTVVTPQVWSVYEGWPATCGGDGG